MPNTIQPVCGDSNLKCTEERWLFPYPFPIKVSYDLAEASVDPENFGSAIALNSYRRT